jgi:hypothetical protein
VRITGTTGKIHTGQATITIPESGRGIEGEFSITCTLTAHDNKTLNTSNTISVDVPKPTEDSANILQLQGTPEVNANYTTNGDRDGACTYTFTSTTAKINCVSTENVIDLSWTFKGVPQSLKQGETITIEIVGEISKRNIAYNVWHPSAEVSATGMAQISGDTVRIGDLDTGWTPRATASFVFQVDPNASEVTIRLLGSYGLGTVATYHYKKRE